MPAASAPRSWTALRHLSVCCILTEEIADRVADGLRNDNGQNLHTNLAVQCRERCGRGGHIGRWGDGRGRHVGQNGPLSRSRGTPALAGPCRQSSLACCAQRQWADNGCWYWQYASLGSRWTWPLLLCR